MNSQPIVLESQAVHSLHGALRTLLADAANLKRDGSDQAVHSARKQMKRIRAGLRLLRSALGDSAYRALNRQVRDAARPLTAVRDATVLMRALELLRRPHDRETCKSYADHANRLLRAELASSRRNFSSKDVHRSAAKLNKVDARMATLPAIEIDLKAARRGMKRTYKNGRRAFARARRRPVIELLHEWRKQVKYLFEESGLVSALFGAKLTKIRRRSRKLGSLLGKDHDLALLKAKLDKFHRKGLLGAQGKARRLFEKRIKHRRQALQAECAELGWRLYRRSPARFEATVGESLANNAAN